MHSYTDSRHLQACVRYDQHVADSLRFIVLRNLYLLLTTLASCHFFHFLKKLL